MFFIAIFVIGIAIATMRKGELSNVEMLTCESALNHMYWSDPVMQV